MQGMLVLLAACSPPEQVLGARRHCVTCSVTMVTLNLHAGAAQALVFANEAVEGWEAGTVASRCAAQEAAKQAAEFSQLAHKLMRAVYRAK